MYQRKQQGSLYSKAFMAFVIGAAVLVGLKAFPIYMNELKVQSAMSGVAASPTERELSVRRTSSGAHVRSICE